VYDGDNLLVAVVSLFVGRALLCWLQICNVVPFASGHSTGAVSIRVTCCIKAKEAVLAFLPFTRRRRGSSSSWKRWISCQWGWTQGRGETRVEELKVSRQAMALNLLPFTDTNAHPEVP
jgi:hypothetical protein